MFNFPQDLQHSLVSINSATTPAPLNESMCKEATTVFLTVKRTLSLVKNIKKGISIQAFIGSRKEAEGRGGSLHQCRSRYKYPCCVVLNNTSQNLVAFSSIV